MNEASTCQCEIIKILEKTSLKEEYLQVFTDNFIDDDALKVLDDEGLQQLIPIVGHRMKIKAALKEWKLLNVSLMNDSALQEIFNSEDINKNCVGESQIITYEVQGNGSLICNSVSQEKNADAGCSIQEEDRIPESLESTKNLKNCSNIVETILNSSSDGRAILAEGRRAEGLLKESERKRLSQIIILHLLEKNPSRTISTCEFQKLSAQIQELFKQESSVVYYSPYEPATGDKSHKKNTSGKLYESYISRRRKLRSRGELPGTSRSSSTSRSTCTDTTETVSITGSDIDLLDDEICEEKLTWLKNSIEPWRLVEEYWRATATVRLKPIIAGEGQISEYFNAFPALAQPLGYTLLLQDFEILHQNKNDGLFSNIVLLREKIVQLARDKVNTTRDKDIKKCILNYIDLTKGLDVMSSGSCSGPGVCGGARRRPPPPPEPAISLAADLSELSLDQGYHTLADCGPPRRRRDNTLSDALWLKILSSLEVSDLCRMSRVCRRWARLIARLTTRPEVWRRVRAAGALEIAARCAGARAGPCVSAVREWRSKSCAVTVTGAHLLAATFRNLTHLAVTGSSSMDARALAPIVTDLVDLRHIDLTGCTNVDWPEWAWLETRLATRKPPVEYIDLTDCGSVTDAGLCALLHTCPSLQYLYLRRCTLVTDAGVRWIPSYCALKELSVSDCTGVTDFGLYELAKLGPALRYLSVAKCTQVSDSGIRTLARRCYKLRYLNARGCGALGDDGVEAVARGCSRLRALDLGATDVSEAGLQILARCCPNLKKLALRGCELIGDEGLEAVAYYCRGLTQLNIQDTPVTLRGYRAVKKYCKRCVIEHTNPGFC